MTTPSDEQLFHLCQKQPALLTNKEVLVLQDALGKRLESEKIDRGRKKFCDGLKEYKP